MKQDGYYIPKNPDVYKAWYENSIFDEEAYYAERQKTILSQDELGKMNEQIRIVKEIANVLKTTPELLVAKVKNLKQECQEISSEIQDLETN
jgi:alanyl-tRNA synthetase